MYNVIVLRWRDGSSNETPLWKGKDNERYLDYIDTKSSFKTQYSHENVSKNKTMWPIVRPSKIFFSFGWALTSKVNIESIPNL